MPVDFVAREPHFLDHLAPIWHALPEEVRGEFRVKRELLTRAHDAGLPATVDRPTDRLTVVAAYGDLKFARLHGARCVLSEHGAGQSYLGTNSGSYVGAADRAAVVAVLVPGEMQAEKHRAAHPDIPAHVVGCPKLDPWHTAGDRARNAQPVVAVSFHWNAGRIAPEAAGAFEWYRPALAPLAAAFPGALGHGHPRAFGRIRPAYRRYGLEPVAEFTDVLDRADLYVCDNSSTIYEFASTGRPVVVLNTPLYRRDVHHGLRFWTHADVGIQVDTHQQLLAAVRTALDDPPEVAARRAEIVHDVYTACDGKAALRAADAVLSELERLS